MMSDSSAEIIAFYSSLTGLPFIVLLVTILVAFGAIVAFILQFRMLRRYQAEIQWHNQQLAKRFQALQGAVAGEHVTSLDENLDTLQTRIAADLASEIAPIARQVETMNAHVTQLRQELTAMIDAANEQEQISRAIEMAKQGARRAEIVEATGISAEKADTIVRFHGPSVS